MRGDRLGLSSSRILCCKRVLLVLLFRGNDGLKGLDSCVSSSASPKQARPSASQTVSRAPCCFGAKLLIVLQMILVAPAPFRFLSPRQEFFDSVSFLSSHCLADRFPQLDQGLGPILPSHIGRGGRGGASLSHLVESRLFFFDHFQRVGTVLHGRSSLL